MREYRNPEIAVGEAILVTVPDNDELDDDFYSDETLYAHRVGDVYETERWIITGDNSGQSFVLYPYQIAAYRILFDYIESGAKEVTR